MADARTGDVKQTHICNFIYDPEMMHCKYIFERNFL